MPDETSEILESLRALHRRFDDEGTEEGGGRPVDYRALYVATVVRQRSIGGELQGVDVIFDDGRIPSIAPLPLTPAIPGTLPVLRKGTRVLIGWQGGDERYPYVAGAWQGGGGLTSLSITSDWTATAVGGDTVTEHDRGGGGRPVAVPLSNDVPTVVVLGRDRMQRVIVTIANAVAQGTPLARVTFARRYSSPDAIVSKDSGNLTINLDATGYTVSAGGALAPAVYILRVYVADLDPP